MMCCDDMYIEFVINNLDQSALRYLAEMYNSDAIRLVSYFREITYNLSINSDQAVLLWHEISEEQGEFWIDLDTCDVVLEIRKYLKL